MLTILRSIIQPRLDYCSQLWSPCDQMSINRLEAIQRRFLSQIRDRELTSLNYWEKLEHLNVLSQERRRERFQICFIWKLSQDLCEGYDIQWQWSEHELRVTRLSTTGLCSSTCWVRRTSTTHCQERAHVWSRWSSTGRR